MNILNFSGYGFKIFGFKAFRKFGYPKLMPQNVVFSITNFCNSRCKTCSIWKKYQQHPELIKTELTTSEWLKVWKSMGKITFITITGGEVFLRKDIDKLLTGAFNVCKPKIMNIPHNASMPEVFKNKLTKFLINTKGKGSVTINLSLDGIGTDHDKIRGIKGNWEKLVETVGIIKDLQKGYPNLNLGVHTVVSKWNVKKIPDIASYVGKHFDPDVYIMEPAEERFELGTIGWKIMPKKGDLIKVFTIKTSGKNHTPIINIVKNIYIDKYIKGKGLPCYAGYNYCQITANGNVWVCCVIADSEPMGNLKKVNFDFKKIWFSDKADSLRRKVVKRQFPECKDCYLACAANTSIPQNILITAKYFVKELFNKR